MDPPFKPVKPYEVEGHDPPAPARNWFRRSPEKNLPPVGTSIDTDAPAASRVRPASLQRPQGAALLLLALLLALVPLLWQVDGPDVVSPSEARMLATSIETWQKRGTLAAPSGPSFEQMVAYRNGMPQYRDPPAPHWLQQIMFAAFPPDHSDELPQALIHRGRLLSVLLAVVTLLCVFWAGQSFAGARAGALAALLLASNPVFLHHAHTASGIMHHLAWATVAIASALWAIRPLKPAPSVERQFLGWVCCGLALGLAFLTAGLLAAGTVAAPILVILILVPGRISHLMGLLAALLIATLLCLPWVIYAHEHDPQTWRTWFGQLVPESGWTPQTMATQAGHRATLLLTCMQPFALWIIAGVIQPLSTASRGDRMRMFVPLAWLAMVVYVLLTAPHTPSWSDMTLALPAFAVTLGLVFRHYDERAAEQRYSRTWRWIRHPHGILLVLASLVVPAALYRPDFLQQQGWLEQGVLPPAPWPLAVALGAGLMMLAAAGLRSAHQHRPGNALAWWSLWGMLLVTSLADPLSRGAWGQNPLRDTARDVQKIVGSRPLYWLQPANIEQLSPPAVLLLYTHRIMPAIAPDQIAEAAQQHRVYYVFARAASETPGVSWAQEPGIEVLGRQLWRCESDTAIPTPPSTPSPSQAP